MNLLNSLSGLITQGLSAIGNPHILIQNFALDNPIIIQFALGIALSFPLGVSYIIALRQRQEHGYIGAGKIASTQVLAVMCLTAATLIFFKNIHEIFIEYEYQAQISFMIILFFLGGFLIVNHNKPPQKAGFKTHWGIFLFNIFNPSNISWLIAYKLLLYPIETGEILDDICIIFLGSFFTWVTTFIVYKRREYELSEISSGYPIGGYILICLSLIMAITVFY